MLLQSIHPYLLLFTWQMSDLQCCFLNFSTTFSFVTSYLAALQNFLTKGLKPWSCIIENGDQHTLVATLEALTTDLKENIHKGFEASRSNISKVAIITAVVYFCGLTSPESHITLYCNFILFVFVYTPVDTFTLHYNFLFYGMEPMDSMLLTAKFFLFLLCCFKFHVNIVNTLHLFTLLLLFVSSF